MPHFIFTTGSVSLFGVLAALCLYFAPALAAFIHAHPRLRIILALNLVVAPVQIVLSRFFIVFSLPSMTMAGIVGAALLVLLGPGWLLLMGWALRPSGAPDARLKAWRETKTWDTVAALPLIAWFLESAMAMRPDLAFYGGLVMAGGAGSLMQLQFISLLLTALFCLSCVWLLLIRDKPVLRTQGLLPRLAALGGTFLIAGMPRLPVPEMPLLQQEAVFLLTGLGSAAAMAALWRLGKSFSILPEARSLVTAGPYRYVRHPLYAAQIVVIFGMILQYRQPWALLLGGAVIALQVVRSVYEERVLARAFPEYEAYRARTRRFIPGVI